jgi:hypothetical protein
VRSGAPPRTSIVDQWWLFWLGAGVVLVAMPAGKLTRITDDAEP